jgi:hypothetical protein
VLWRCNRSVWLWAVGLWRLGMLEWVGSFGCESARMRVWSECLDWAIVMGLVTMNLVLPRRRLGTGEHCRIVRSAVPSCGQR